MCEGCGNRSDITGRALYIKVIEGGSTSMKFSADPMNVNVHFYSRMVAGKVVPLENDEQSEEE